jgi:hypothetical protein
VRRSSLAPRAFCWWQDGQAARARSFEKRSTIGCDEGLFDGFVAHASRQSRSDAYDIAGFVRKNASVRRTNAILTPAAAAPSTVLFPLALLLLLLQAALLFLTPSLFLRAPSSLFFGEGVVVAVGLARDLERFARRAVGLRFIDVDGDVAELVRVVHDGGGAAASGRYGGSNGSSDDVPLGARKVGRDGWSWRVCGA